jgi:hypothetical protein
VSFCTRGTCPHDRGVFAWLGDGPWFGDPADPDHGNFPWVHDTTMPPGHLEVCELKPFATPEEAGELCACGHPSHEHHWPTGPVTCEYRPVPCPCGCPDFRHRPEDLERWREAERGRRGSSPVPVAVAAVVAEPETAADEAGQLELFPSAARKPRRQARRTATVPAGGGML